MARARVRGVRFSQIVSFAIIDGHGPGELDVHFGWPRGTVRDVLREALGRYGGTAGHRR